MELLGTHGTSQARAKLIQAQNAFKPGGQSGRAGTGVYFWPYEKNPELAHALATEWWEFASRKLHHSEKPCSVVYVTLNVEEGKYFDCCTTEFREGLYVAATKQNVRTSWELNRLFDMILTELEKRLGAKLQVIHAAVPTPRADDGVPLLKFIFGASNCYVVRRDFKSVIRIDKVI